jgi:putative endonuclease
MPLFARLIFGLVNFAARNGITQSAPAESVAGKKLRARQTGIRGETFAYWYLRRHGYILIARNFTVSGLKGELDLVGYDGPVLAFVEVKTRAGDSKEFGSPEDAITPHKKDVLVRMARHFLLERRLRDTLWRFDVLAIEARPGRRPLVRLHKDAFSH